MLSDEYSVLLIDDDADVLDAYTLLLEQEGYHVFACSNPLMPEIGCRPTGRDCPERRVYARL